MKSPPKSRYFQTPERFFLPPSQTRTLFQKSTHYSDLYLPTVCFSDLLYFLVSSLFCSALFRDPSSYCCMFFFFYFCVVFHRTTALSFIHPIANDFLWFGWSETRWWRDTVVDQEKSGLSIYNSFTSCKRILCASCSHISNFSRSFLEMQSLAKKSFG